MTESSPLLPLAPPHPKRWDNFSKRLIAAISTSVLVAGAQTAHAGVNAWTSHGPDGGCIIRALGIDPIAPNTLYAGGCRGLVSKSTDSGDTWSAVGKLDAPKWASSGTDVSVLALAIDPATPSTLYAGTYAAYTGWGDLGLVFRSTDGGGTWSAVDAKCHWGGEDHGFLSFPNPFPGAIAIDPTMPRTLYTSGCKSTDGGDTWQVQPFGVCSAVAIDPLMPDTLFGGCYDGFFKTVSKSTDGGSNWSDASIGLQTNSGALALAIDPSLPTTLYAATNGGVFKTMDSGSSWSAVNTGLGVTVVHALAIDPSLPSTLYAGADGGVFKSTDSGGTWSARNTGLPAGSSVTAFAIDPAAPSTLYAGTDSGGVFSIEQVRTCGGDCNADGGATVDELVTLVNVALGTTSVVECGSGDANGDGQIAIDEIITAVSVVLEGCHAAAL